jgi:hypothetical protein
MSREGDLSVAVNKQCCSLNTVHWHNFTKSQPVQIIFSPGDSDSNKKEAHKILEAWRLQL